MRVSIGDFHVGPYCGSRILSRRDWRMYGLYRRIKTGFSIGPILFWKERIK